MWDKDFAQQLALRIDAMDAIRGAAPEVSVLVDSQAIAVSRFDLVKDLAAREAFPVRRDIEGADILPGIVLGLVAGLGNVKPAFIRREGEPVRSIEIVGHEADLIGLRVETI